MTVLDVELPAAPGNLSRGVYVHIPFCIVRCAYCDFNAYAGMEDLIEPYTEALLREIDTVARRVPKFGPVGSVFFGGGTPTQIPLHDLVRILNRLQSEFEISSDAEVTVEANPETVDVHTFDFLRNMGFNRVSIGIQSFDPDVLRRLGRVHGPDRAGHALRAARQAGFERINGDLIYGTPGETLASWMISLEKLIDEEVDHISAYALTIEEGTPLSSLIARGRERPPDEDDQADKYLATVELLESNGIARYEISNFAREGSWCFHNLGYWRNFDYLGFGAGAHSHVRGRRSKNVLSPRTYIDRSSEVVDESCLLDPGQEASDAAILGMRLAGGIEVISFHDQWGVDPISEWESSWELLVDEGLVEMDSKSIRPSARGFLLGGRIARALV